MCSPKLKKISIKIRNKCLFLVSGKRGKQVAEEEEVEEAPAPVQVEPEGEPEGGGRRRRAAASISFKEPSLRGKMRQVNYNSGRNG